LDEEAAIFEAECVEIGLGYGRKHLFLFRVILGTAIHKAVLLPGVAVEITV